MGNRLIHFDFSSSDPLASVAFFEQALGWHFHQWDEAEYWLAHTGEEGEPGINGAVSRTPEGVPPHVLNTVSVPDLEAAMASCEKAGGTCVSEIVHIPEVGRWVGIREPGGNEFGIIEMREG